VGIEVHLRIHDGRWVPDAWKAHHLSHHVRPQKNFNIFLPIFDWLLGSKNLSFFTYELRSVVDGIKEEYRGWHKSKVQRDTGFR
jgi:sterol desaturase/sphingolipid hydroxylase (fatty acid hydroxylase superfamily)